MNSHQESKILGLFADDPRAPFSIHKFVDYGASYCGKHPGEWFGPSATAKCIQYAPLAFSSQQFFYLSNQDIEAFQESLVTQSSEFMSPTTAPMFTKTGFAKSHATMLVS